MKAEKHMELLRWYHGNNNINDLISDHRFSLFFRIKLLWLKLFNKIKIYQIN